MKRMCAVAALLALWSTGASAQAIDLTPPQAEARAMFARLVAFPTVAGRGAVPAMADYLASELEVAGFDRSDIRIDRLGETASLTVTYRGPPDPAKAPVLFLAHMDVVEAVREDWTHDPWVLTEVDAAFHGRGVVDNKYGLLTIVQAFIRLKGEGFVPDRDLVIAFSGDEETGMQTTRALATRLQGAAFALNSDAGGGFSATTGGTAMYAVQAAEKTYATFEVTARNSGGHSSSPRPDNAIYELANALEKLAGHRFPIRWNAVSLAAFAALAPTLDDEVGTAMARFAEAPGDAAAVAVMEQEPWVDRDLRTTCVATMLRAGHAENALPATATATVNCRIFPGETIAETEAVLKQVMADETLEVTVLGDPLESPVSEVPPEVKAALAAMLSVRAPGAVASPYQEAGGTDGLHFRRAGIATVGVGPIFSTAEDEYNFHGNNEHMPVDQFYDGIDHFYLIIKALAGPQQVP